MMCTPAESHQGHDSCVCNDGIAEMWTQIHDVLNIILDIRVIFEALFVVRGKGTINGNAYGAD